MSVLWFAPGEEIEFPTRLAGTVTDSVDSTARRTSPIAYTRGCIYGDGRNTGGTVLADGVPFTPITTGWLSLQGFRDFSGDGVLADAPEFGLGGSVAVGGLFIGRDSTSHTKLALYKVTSGGGVTKLVSEIGTTYTMGLIRIDIHVENWNHASLGRVRVYLNSNTTPTIDFLGDLTSSGVTSLDRFRMLSTGVNFFGFPAPQAASEIIVTDSEDTRAYIGVASLELSAAGTTNTFTTGAYTDVNEAVLDDATRIASDTAAQEFDANLVDLPAGNFAICGFKVSARAIRGAGGPSILQMGINSGGTRNVADKSLTLALDTYERIMPINSITAVPFTKTEINSLQVCLKSKT